MCGFVRELDRQNEEIEERKQLIKVALAPLEEEHRRWAKMFGAALALTIQGDYSEVDKLAREVRYEFIDGEPVIKSAALSIRTKPEILAIQLLDDALKGLVTKVKDMSPDDWQDANQDSKGELAEIRKSRTALESAIPWLPVAKIGGPIC